MYVNTYRTKQYNIMIVCEECKGKNIQIFAWVDANTNKYCGDFTDETEDKWCSDCEEHVDFIDEDDIEED